MDTLKQEIKSLLHQVQMISDETTRVDTLKAGIAHLKSAVLIMKAVLDSSQCSIVPNEKIVPNRNNTVQPRFINIRKRNSLSI